ncbi:MAG: hypothetical protein R3213_07760 [Flavobacteriaceae bacterium]|nr:hypothetical protein [Flavobacteriaceae bacterium]
MKKSTFFKIFTIVAIVITVLCCSSLNQEDITPPFEIKTAYFSHYVGGVAGGGTGINLVLELTNPPGENITIDSIFHKNRAAKLDLNRMNARIYSANILLDQNSQETLILSGDMDEELVNQLPQNQRKMPLSAEKNEFVLSYHVDGKEQYFILDKVEEKSSNYKHQ